MNKLVSRNPILRFKEGKKIEKMQLGNIFKRYFNAINKYTPVKEGTYYEKTDKLGNVLERGRFINGQYQAIQEISNTNLPDLVVIGNRRKKRNSKNANPVKNNKQILKSNTLDLSIITPTSIESVTLPKVEPLSFNTKFNPSMDLPITKMAALNDAVSNLNIPVQQQTFDRANIRQYIRDKGFNPYQFSGALRKALRMVLNGSGTDDDKALVQSMGIFKKGGQLPSRNIIERFKQGGILKFLTAGNLPTAPKAEKRYRKNSYNTTKEGNRETTTITSRTFGYNRNWPYFRQPATILRIIEGGDTAFVETPEHHIFTKVLPRTALKSGNIYTEYDPKYDKNYSLGGQANTLFNYRINPLEYEILKHRFNTAWNLAK